MLPVSLNPILALMRFFVNPVPKYPVKTDLHIGCKLAKMDEDDGRILPNMAGDDNGYS